MNFRSGNRILLALVTMTCLVACKKSDPEPTTTQTSTGTTYLVMGNNLQGTGGSLATYAFETNTLKTDAYVAPALADMVMDNGKLYVSIKTTKTIEFLDLKSFSTSKSPAFGKDTKNFPNFIYKHLAIASNKIFISDQVNVAGVNKCFLKAMSLSDPTQVDSVSIEPDAVIVSLLAVNNKIFVSTKGDYYNNSYIFVIDAGSYSVLSKMNVGTPCSQLTLDTDSNVMGIQFGSLLRINTTDFSMTKTSFFGTTLIESSGGSLAVSSLAVDRDANAIYYLSLAAQPSPAPYVLNAFDLSSKTSKNLTTAFIQASTIAFDKKNKVIVVGSANYNGFVIDPKDPNKGLLTFYSTEGTLLNKVTLPNVPEKILILE